MSTPPNERSEKKALNPFKRTKSSDAAGDDDGQTKMAKAFTCAVLVTAMMWGLMPFIVKLMIFVGVSGTVYSSFQQQIVISTASTNSDADGRGSNGHGKKGSPGVKRRPSSLLRRKRSSDHDETDSDARGHSSSHDR